MTLINSTPMKTAVIYMGGTFGCAGTPLKPLPANVFLPKLELFVDPTSGQHIQFFYSTHIKDSSQLAPHDWHALINQIEALRDQQYQHFLIIHGTDTLAYSAAFLAEFYDQQKLSIVFTGSQYPLLHADDLSINPLSDAPNNFNFALNTLSQINNGVWVAFNQQCWPAQSVQKIHTTAHNAFAGSPPSSIPAHPTTQSLDLTNRLSYLDRLPQVNLAVFYCLPMTTVQLCQQLKQLLSTPKLDVLILMAFGSGNMPQHADIEQLLNIAKQNNILVILSTQVAFGGTASLYAAGHWLKELGVVSSNELPLPALYARLLWLCCQYSTLAQRKQHFLDLYPPNTEQIQ